MVLIKLFLLVQEGRIKVDEPLWDLSTFVGRLKHFFYVTDPRTVLTSSARLQEAKALLEQYKWV